MEERKEEFGKSGQGESSDGESTASIWILVDQASREGAFEQVISHLEKAGVDAQLVTITEVLGTVARDALAGGAERLLRGLKVAIRGRGVDEDLLGALRRSKPRVLALTHASHARTLSVVENVAGIDSLHVGILSDYDLAGPWLASSLQAFIVPHEEHRERLGRVGIASDRVLIAGPPLRGGVEGDLDRNAIRSELGLGDDFVILVRADGFDVATLDKLVFQCTLADRPVRFIFHHNSDAATSQTLRRAADQYRLKAAMFGRVDDLERYLLAADGVIVSPREGWMAELVALQRPVLIVGSDENRAFQSDFLVRQGIARSVPDIVRLGSELDRFADPATREPMEKACAEIAAPRGSEHVAEALRLALEHADTWRQPLQPPAGQEQPRGEDPSTQGKPAQGEDKEAPVKGPFESIGQGAESGPGAGAGAGAGGTTASGEAGREQTRPSPTREYAGLSQAEAKEQLAQLILLERDLERRVSEIERQQERWKNRLDLAREWNEEDLAREAESVLRGYLSEAESLNAELADVRLQKDKLRQAARSEAERRAGGTSAGRGQEPPAHPGAGSERIANMEGRFQKMEVDSDLKGLKDRIRRELGE